MVRTMGEAHIKDPEFGGLRSSTNGEIKEGFTEGKACEVGLPGGTFGIQGDRAPVEHNTTGFEKSISRGTGVRN